MKTLLPSLLLSATFALSLHGQTQLNHCGTMPLLEQHQQQNPGLSANMLAAEQAAAQWLHNNPTANKAGQVVTIPVVVHVVYADSTMNISDAQVLSQIEILNEDFRRLNADAANTRSVFEPVAADTEIEFCLARRDPDGNPTTGITRTYSSGGILFGYFGPTDDVKSTTTGGVDPWPSDQYLNIWVCNLLPILLGYAQFPGDDPATDGVVIGYNYFGNIGTVTAPYDKGRTTTHEVGHWLGLRHIWGDAACASDSVADTPLAADATSGCDTTANTCTDSPVDLPDMIENYMDYSDDDCMNMFTLGQKDRMWSFLNTARLSLQTSMGCVLPVAVEDPQQNALEVGLAPNPNNGVFRFWVKGKQNDAFSAKVTDLSGKVIWTADEIPSNTESVVDLRSQANGLYLLQVSNGHQMEVLKLQITR
jgi:hypothetical protein